MFRPHTSPYRICPICEVSVMLVTDRAEACPECLARPVEKPPKAKVDPQKAREWRLRNQYGLTPEEWEIMFEAQGRRCYFGCETPGRSPKAQWQTDHDHETGRVRAIFVCTP